MFYFLNTLAVFWTIELVIENRPAHFDGCLAGAVSLPITGPTWQVMRPSRNRNWGNPQLIRFIERFATNAKKVGWNGLLVGDMSQPRGGQTWRRREAQSGSCTERENLAGDAKGKDAMGRRRESLHSSALI